MAQKCYVNVDGGTREVTKIYVNVGGVNRVVTKAYVNVSGVNRVWWPNTGGGVPPLAPGNYEPNLVSGGGVSGGTFDMSPYLGSNITAVAAKISYRETLPDSFIMTVTGDPTNTFYRTIDIVKDFSSRTIYHDLGATAASQFDANNADGYKLSSLTVPWVTRTRLRITIS